MKKGFKIFTAGTIVCLVGGTIIKESIQSIQEIKEAKQSVEAIGEILDPFVNLYTDSDYNLESFERIIREKLTLSEVKILRSVLSNRYNQMSVRDRIYGYSRMVEMIDNVVPKEGSLSDGYLLNQKRIKNG